MECSLNSKRPSGPFNLESEGDRLHFTWRATLFLNLADVSLLYEYFRREAVVHPLWIIYTMFYIVIL